MGNRSGCSLFTSQEGGGSSIDARQRASDDRLYWIDGLTEEENRVIKDIYSAMQIATNESTIIELKRSLDLQMIFMRKRKRVTRRLEEVFDYIEMTLKKDIAIKTRYRIGLDEFYQLWESALNEKVQEDLAQQSELSSCFDHHQSIHDNDRGGFGFGCMDCIPCQKRDKLPKPSVLDLSQRIRMQHNLKHHKEYLKQLKHSNSVRSTTSDSFFSLQNAKTGHSQPQSPRELSNRSLSSHQTQR